MHTPRPDRAEARPNDIQELGTVLGIWAHPDDETFLSAGLMAAARDAGQRVVCVTATLGERGTGDAKAWPPARLAAVRERELRASLAALGVHEHRLLGYQDGACDEQAFDRVVDRLETVIREVRPQTIVTFGPDGLTGHSDHQAVSRWATAARASAAPDARLLYTTTTAEFVDRWRHVHEQFDVFLAHGLPLRTPQDSVGFELRLDEESADRKLVALRAQATQTARMVAELGEREFRDWWSVESFVDAENAPAFATWGTWTTAA